MLGTRGTINIDHLLVPELTFQGDMVAHVRVIHSQGPTASPGAEQALTVGFPSLAVREGGADT